MVIGDAAFHIVKNGAPLWCEGNVQTPAPTFTRDQSSLLEPFGDAVHRGPIDSDHPGYLLLVVTGMVMDGVQSSELDRRHIVLSCFLDKY